MALLLLFQQATVAPGAVLSASGAGVATTATAYGTGAYGDTYGGATRLALTAALAGSGGAQATGTATALAQSQPLAATGTAQATGSASRLTQTQPLAASGTGQATGSATALKQTAALAATGAGLGAGSGDLGLAGSGAVLAASGTGTASGAATRLTLTAALAASGTGNATAVADLLPGAVGAGLAALGTAQATGGATTLRFAVRALAATGNGAAVGSAGLTSGTGGDTTGIIHLTLRDPLTGAVRDVLEVEGATLVAAGWVELMPPYIVQENDNGAWDTGPFYVIRHADGRTFATTQDNFVHYYERLGFVVLGEERTTAVYP